MRNVFAKRLRYVAYHTNFAITDPGKKERYYKFLKNRYKSLSWKERTKFSNSL